MSKESPFLEIAGRKIGPGHSCFVIAEAGVNHNGNMEIGHQLIDAAREAGADAVKFQAFRAEDLATRTTPKAAYQKETTGSDGAMFEMLKGLEISDEDQAALKAHSDEVGITYLCTPYEEKSADMLERISVAAYKVASTDTTNIPFLRHLAEKKLPIILSTGMCTFEETRIAIETLTEGGLDGKVAVLHCTSQYPAPYDELNLRVIPMFAETFRIPIGYSDHTPGVGASPWAVALGACIIEKHFTLDRTMEGPDHRASMEPDELRALVGEIRNVEAALGSAVKQITKSEAANKTVMQKSLVARRPIAKGEVITADALTCMRPATGISPARFEDVVGNRATRDIAADEQLVPEAVGMKPPGKSSLS